MTTKRKDGPMQLSADGRETLEDALRIYTETAGDAEGRAEREAAVRRLEAELREPDPAPQWLELGAPSRTPLEGVWQKPRARPPAVLDVEWGDAKPDEQREVHRLEQEENEGTDG